MQRLRAHVGFALPVELDIGFPAVRPVPQEHSIPALDQFLGQGPQARNFLAEPATWRQCNEIACLTQDFVDDVAAVDVDRLLGHACTSTSLPTTRTGYVRMLHSGLTAVVPVASSKPH